MALNKLVLLLSISWIMGTASTARELPMKLGNDLTARLDGGGGMMECWNAFVELRSCTNEIVLFFVNGDTHLGPDCCRAIGIITRQCWPSMLTSLGFTSEEGYVLQGYCDASSAPPLPVVTPLLVEPPV
ncbi:hypothetical protein HHK36_009237 [Tetracentron sinense]|uniref:Prolamin-like domain-containing protein n=1 Tax=Tetracentron sinense TaxID=13715 RepID=A0A834ZBE2_TETSI|nr:hypothetical protein HHK36_009237 [Tetracentron sinense]